MAKLEREDVVAAISKHIKQIIKDDFPERVKAVRDIAIDRFGEENVDLQVCETINIWMEFCSHMTFNELMSRIGVECDHYYDDSYSARYYLFFSDNLEMFLKHFTEDKIKNCYFPIFSVIIKFNNLVVSNEHGASTVLEDFYTAVPLTYNGLFVSPMVWIRATYSRAHYESGYMHSHVSGIGSFVDWKIPCLGSGPINKTKLSLSGGFNESLWMLFWCELDQCVRVESLTGGPYRYLAEIPRGNTITGYYSELPNYDFNTPEYGMVIAKQVLKTGKLKFAFKENRLYMQNDYRELVLLISNAYLEYLYERFTSEHDRIAVVNNHLEDGRMYVGQFTVDYRIARYALRRRPDVPDDGYNINLVFKGNQVKVTIIKEEEEEECEKENTWVLLDMPHVAPIVTLINLIANYVYIRHKGTGRNGGNTGTDCAG